MTLVWEKGHLQKKQVFKALTGFLSPSSDHKNSLRQNKLSARSDKVLSPKVLVNITQYTKKNLEQVIQIVFQAQTLKEKTQDKIFKAKLPNIYCGKFYLEYYNFC